MDIKRETKKSCGARIANGFRTNETNSPVAMDFAQTSCMELAWIGSAQTGKAKIMRTIDADELMNALRDAFTEEENDHHFLAEEWWWAPTVRKVINNVPVLDVTPIVRCKDCTNRDRWGCPWWKDEPRPEDWYCADGERRTDEAD